MEETFQQEKEESENKNQNEEQGGIRRRLRDRDLLRKRKAEAEDKETNQWVLGVESQRKRPRAESGTKRRGRPKRSELTSEIPVIQEEAAAGPQEGPEPAEDIPVQAQGSLLAVETQPSSALAPPAPLPVFGDIQNPFFAPSLIPPTPLIPFPDLFSPSPPAPASSKIPDMSPIPVQDLAPVPEAVPVQVPAPVMILDPFPAAAPAPPAAPPQVETLFIESQGRKAIGPVHVEDLDPDEEADISPSQDQTAEEDLIEPPSINVPEQNEMFSIPTWSSTPPPQRYFPGNAF
ncbi:actin cytoskeleton-regulatory complex protein PAN1 isoform X3 [Notothenia coriiceps]|uniref:Actin cytoskeleton-regulatory complex protein PAN1 isoform X3 n=1 Tax=Notothenia coriiceps TaxID=8208 RepID=A0A6I9NF24_9TELE|nr:PREDICTED: hemogen isoform X3 [Notothenia coriiceps]